MLILLAFICDGFHLLAHGLEFVPPAPRTESLLLHNVCPTFLDACQTDDQRTPVRASYVEAQRNYWNFINEIFHDDDPSIEQVVEQIDDAQDSLERMMQDLANIEQVINPSSTAVKIGTELASMAR